jgi:hypothetical protein
MDIETTNPVDGADTSAEDIAASGTEVDREREPQPGEDGDAIDPPEDEEIELDGGLKLVVPKDQAQKVRDGWLRQADYTRKTQALSEERRAVEAERAVLQQASQQELSAYAEATSFGSRINELDRTAAGFGGWAAWAREDPFAANEAHMARAELDRARNFSLGQLQQYRGQRISFAQQDTARRVEEARFILEQDKEIGGWDDHKAAEMLTAGIREYGFDRSEIEELSDARMVKVLHDGLKWRAHLIKQQQAQRHVRAQQVEPAASVGARSAPAHGLDDRLGTEEWVRRRNAQVRKRA